MALLGDEDEDDGAVVGWDGVSGKEVERVMAGVKREVVFLWMVRLVLDMLVVPSLEMRNLRRRV